jgi:hypothetical protein
MRLSAPSFSRNFFSPGLRTALSPLMRTNREKQFPSSHKGRCGLRLCIVRR